MHEATILRSTPYGCYIGLSTSLWSIGIEHETKTEIPNTFVKVHIHHLKEMGHFKQFKRAGMQIIFQLPTGVKATAKTMFQAGSA